MKRAPRWTIRICARIFCKMHGIAVRAWRFALIAIVSVHQDYGSPTLKSLF